MNTKTITAKHCVIEDFVTEEEVEFDEIVDKAKRIAKELGKVPFLDNDKWWNNKVTSIDFKEEEMKAVINYELVENISMNNL